MSIMAEHYHLPQRADYEKHWISGNIFTDTDSIMHNRACNPYMTCLQKNTYHSDKQEDKTPDQYKLDSYPCG